MIYAELLRDACEACSGAQCQHAMALVQRLMMDDNWIWEEKYNGDRRVTSKQGDRIIDYNRKADRGKGFSSSNVVAALKQHPLPQFVVDGEFCTYNNKYYLFDALYLGDHEIVSLPLKVRKQYLRAAFEGFHQDIVVVEGATTPEEKLALYQRLEEEFAEGFCMKDLRAPYRQSNPSGTLRYNYRYKFVKTMDAVVIGDSTERDDKGMLKNSVRLGVYMPNGFLKDICGATKKSRFVLKPGDVVELAYLYGTGTLDVVQPRILHKRDDKYAHECTVNQIIVNKNWRKQRG